MLTLSEERKFHLIFARGSESSRRRKCLETRVPGNDFRSWERKYVGTKVPVTGANVLPNGTVGRSSRAFCYVILTNPVIFTRS